MKKLKKITIISLAMLLIMGISYALLNDTITISGSATTTGTLDVNVTSASVSTQVGSINSSITYEDDSVSFTVPQLEYPGAYTIFSVTVQNQGTLSAKLKTIAESSMGDANVLVTYTGIAVNQTLAVNETKTFTIKVEWRSTSEASSTDGVNIRMDLVYEQNI